MATINNDLRKSLIKYFLESIPDYELETIDQLLRDSRIHDVYTMFSEFLRKLNTNIDFKEDDGSSGDSGTGGAFPMSNTGSTEEMDPQVLEFYSILCLIDEIIHEKNSERKELLKRKLALLLDAYRNTDEYTAARGMGAGY